MRKIHPIVFPRVGRDDIVGHHVSLGIPSSTTIRVFSRMLTVLLNFNFDVID